MFQNHKLDNKPSLRQLPPNLHLAKTNAKETLSHHQMLTDLFLMTQENGSIIARVWGWFAYSYCSAYHRQDHGCLYEEVWGVYEEERWAHEAPPQQQPPQMERGEGFPLSLLQTHRCIGGRSLALSRDLTNPASLLWWVTWDWWWCGHGTGPLRVQLCLF